MEDLNARLDKLLEDPSLSDKVMGVLNSLGVQTENIEGKEHNGAEHDGNGTGGIKDGGSPPVSEMVNMGQLLGLFSAARQGNVSHDGDLLDAIAPYLRPSRRKHVEEAKTLMTVWRLLPLLGLFGDNGKKEE